MLSVRLADPADVDAATAALADLAAGEEPRCRRRDAARSRWPSPTRRVGRGGAASGRAALPIAAVELQQPSLDDVFLTLTGRPTERRDPTKEAA